MLFYMTIGSGQCTRNSAGRLFGKLLTVLPEVANDTFSFILMLTERMKPTRTTTNTTTTNETDKDDCNNNDVSGTYNERYKSSDGNKRRQRQRIESIEGRGYS